MNKRNLVASLKASISGSKIFLEWSWVNNTIPLFVQNIGMYSIVEGNSKGLQSYIFENSSLTKYEITNIELEANYRICLKVVMTSKWPGIREPDHKCTSVSNNWELSAFFGSTAGALLALILIILLILFSKRAKKRQKALKADANDKPKRQRFDSAFESQFDSVAFREDTSFYDEYIISDISFFDSSIRSSSDANISPNNNHPTVIVGELSSLKGIKKRASLIEEESNGGHSADLASASLVFRDRDVTYHSQSETPLKVVKPASVITENKNSLIETCIDEMKDDDT